MSLLFEDIRSEERTNFVNGLCNCSSTVTPRCEMFLEISSVKGKVGIFGADAAESESLAVSDAGLAVTGMATSRMKVLVGVCRFGVEICGDPFAFLTVTSRKCVSSGEKSEVNLMVL